MLSECFIIIFEQNSTPENFDQISPLFKQYFESFLKRFEVILFPSFITANSPTPGSGKKPIVDQESKKNFMEIVNSSNFHEILQFFQKENIKTNFDFQNQDAFSEKLQFCLAKFNGILRGCADTQEIAQFFYHLFFERKTLEMILSLFGFCLANSFPSFSYEKILLRILEIFATLATHVFPILELSDEEGLHLLSIFGNLVFAFQKDRFPLFTKIHTSKTSANMFVAKQKAGKVEIEEFLVRKLKFLIIFPNSLLKLKKISSWNFQKFWILSVS